MITKISPIAFLFLFSMSAWSSEVIVCIPLEISFKSSSNELAIVPKVEEDLPKGYSGSICNSSRAWCKPVALQRNVVSRVKVARSEISREMVYFQTEYNAQNNSGGCRYNVNM